MAQIINPPMSTLFVIAAQLDSELIHTYMPIYRHSRYCTPLLVLYSKNAILHIKMKGNKKSLLSRHYLFNVSNKGMTQQVDCIIVLPLFLNIGCFAYLQTNSLFICHCFYAYAQKSARPDGC